VARKVTVTRLLSHRYVLSLVVGAVYLPVLLFRACMRWRDSTTEGIPGPSVKSVLGLMAISLLEHISLVFLYLPAAVLDGWETVAFLEFALPVTVLLSGCVHWRAFSLYHYVGSIAVILGTVIGVTGGTTTPVKSWSMFLYLLSTLLAAANDLLKSAHLEEHEADLYTFNALVSLFRFAWGVLMLPVGITLQDYLRPENSVWQPGDAGEDPLTALESLWTCVTNPAAADPGNKCGPEALVLVVLLVCVDAGVSAVYQWSLQPAGAQYLSLSMTAGCIIACICFLSVEQDAGFLATVSACTIFVGSLLSRCRNEKAVVALERSRTPSPQEPMLSMS